MISQLCTFLKKSDFLARFFKEKLAINDSDNENQINKIKENFNIEIIALSILDDIIEKIFSSKKFIEKRPEMDNRHNQYKRRQD